MPKTHELFVRHVFHKHAHNYLPEGDHYLSQEVQPDYRFNVIGTGMIGQEHINVTMLEGRATVHGVFDPNPRSIEGAQAVYGRYANPNQLKIYDSLQAACHDPEVDALLICTPNFSHIAIVREAIQSGKHIFLEKPMATTLADAYEIAQIAQNYEGVFQIGLQYRYKAIYAEALHEALDRQALGSIKTLSLLEHRLPFFDKVGQWNKFSEYSGGTLVEKCCHYFDLLNLLAQSLPKEVYCSASMAVNFRDFEYDAHSSDIIDNASTIITYENGVRAQFNLCMFAPMFYEELIVCGEQGHLKAWENQDFLLGAPLETSLDIRCGANRPSRNSSPHYPSLIEESGHHGSTYFEHVYFVDNIKGIARNTATAKEGFWSVVVGLAAEESWRTQQVVKVEELLSRLDLPAEETDWIR